MVNRVVVYKNLWQYLCSVEIYVSAFLQPAGSYNLLLKYLRRD